MVENCELSRGFLPLARMHVVRFPPVVSKQRGFNLLPPHHRHKLVWTQCLILNPKISVFICCWAFFFSPLVFTLGLCCTLSLPDVGTSLPPTCRSSSLKLESCYFLSLFTKFFINFCTTFQMRLKIDFPPPLLLPLSNPMLWQIATLVQKQNKTKQVPLLYKALGK